MPDMSVPPENLRRILIIKMRYIGDTVLVTPLIRALKAGLPRARIDVLVNRDTAPVLDGHWQVGRIWQFDYPRAKKNPVRVLPLMKQIRDQRYDLVIDLTNNDRSALFTRISGAALRIGYYSEHRLRRKMCYTHVIDAVLGDGHTTDHHLKPAALLGLPVSDPHPELTVLPARAKAVEEKLGAAGIGPNTPFAVIHPGARRWYKSWPPERFARLADAITETYGIPVVLSGSPGDRAVCDRIAAHMGRTPLSLAGAFALGELPALISKSICLIGNDSAPIHIATAVRTPAIALFGPTPWAAWYPRREQDKVIAAEYPCRPCGHSRADCPLGDGYCMGSIRFETVWEATDSILKQHLGKDL
ncbi:hypothetical protein DENIS_2596 [Desulfonema ishimotonii]|uniref:lipopolysaccharide heptosyltransferase II n=2 Tax=Desulfonema ishimotonii TaxID=45657 RepID=A0A401FXG8_9BACT|nr:hypothetical protein DENIS_2596 [Desulfonema ishimotonii]